MKRRVAILISGRGSNMAALIRAAAAEDFPAEIVQRWYGRMLNIHPSLLPSFPGLEPQAQALRAGVKISGATVHFVIPETDAGPILIQGAVAVRDSDTPDTLAARILEAEHRIYPDALRLVAGGQIRLEGG